jgi:UDP-N-acetyl-D-mannosaminuronic acid dehydrogenase
LSELFEEVVRAGRLRFRTAPVCADAFVITVPTPITESKEADMRYVEAATRSIVPHLKKGNVVILESTSPPRTVVDLMLPILAGSGLVLGEELFVAHSPERVMPGNIINELIAYDRVVGGINEKSSEKAAALFRSFVKGDIVLTDATTAEMCKLMENTFRDVNIALANEFAKICENVGVNVWEIIALANRHPRAHIHQPGPGVGGHCIAVDPWFIAQKDPEQSQLIQLSRHINDGMPQFVFEKAMKLLAGSQKKVSILGVTYKPNVDDTRESPILKLIELFEGAGVSISLYDPYVKNAPHI